MAGAAGAAEEEVIDGEVVEESDTADLFAEFSDKKSGPAPEKSEEENEETDEDEEESEEEGEEEEEKASDKDAKKDVAKEDAKSEKDDKKPEEKDGPTREELLAQIETLQHKVKSQDGRNSALQKKINKIEKQARADIATPEDFAKAFKDEESWKEFAELHPEFAGVLEGIMDGFATNIKANLEKQAAETQDIKVVADKQADKEAEAAISEQYPEWKTWVNTPTFGKWLANQPAYVMEVVEEGTVEESLNLFENYQNYLIATGQLKLESDEDSENSEPTEEEKLVAKTKEKRSKQLKDGATTPSKSGSATPITEDTTSSLFDYFSNKRTRSKGKR